MNRELRTVLIAYALIIAVCIVDGVLRAGAP